jgi:hypothetical protein
MYSATLFRGNFGEGCGSYPPPKTEEFFKIIVAVPYTVFSWVAKVQEIRACPKLPYFLLLVFSKIIQKVD